MKKEKNLYRSGLKLIIVFMQLVGIMPGGRPVSTEPLIERFLKRVNKTDTCWLWTGNMQKNGYGSVCSRNLQDTWGTRFAHRWSYMYHKGEIAEGMMVRHTCDVRNCVNPAHLVLGTSMDNVHDMLERNPNGCNRHFGQDDILKIREGYKTKSYADLALEWGVAKSTICNIVTRKYYNYFE
jgi:hypothetical protein